MTDQYDDDDAVSGASSDPETESAPPSGGVTLSTDATPRDIALEGLTDTEKHAVVMSATDIDVHSPQDATWILLRKIRDGIAAAQASSDAAGRIEVATRGVSQTIYDQTVRAGNDLKSLVSQGIRETTADIGKKIGTAIDIVTKQGAERISQAAGEVDQVTRDHLAKTVQEYRGYLVQAAASEASRRGSLAAATSWIAVLVTCVTFLIGGAILVHEYEVYARHLLPPGYSLLYKTNGQPACGFIQSFGQVCGVRR